MPRRRNVLSSVAGGGGEGGRYHGKCTARDMLLNQSLISLCLSQTAHAAKMYIGGIRVCVARQKLDSFKYRLVDTVARRRSLQKIARI